MIFQEVLAIYFYLVNILYFWQGFVKTMVIVSMINTKSHYYKITEKFSSKKKTII